MPTLVDLVRRPRAFFAAVAAPARPSLVGPALIAVALGATGVARLLALVGVLGDVSGTFQGNRLVYAVGRLDVSAPRELVVGSALVLLVFVVGWLVAAAFVYAVARYFDPTGSFRDLLACLGWAQLPVLVPATLSTGYVLIVVARAPELATDAAAREWLAATFEQSTVQLGLTVLDPLVAVWVAALWALGTAEALGLSRRQAAVCVAIPAALLVLNAIGGVFAISR